MANFSKKLVEMLTDPNSTKSDIASLLMQNDVEISDEDLDMIERNRNFNKEEEFEEIPYTLSPDGKSFLINNTASMPKDVKQSFVSIPTKEEARFLQDIYYQMQDRRIALQGQIRSIMQGADSESQAVENTNDNLKFLEWLFGQMMNMENNIKMALEAFSDSYYLSRWAKQVCGIGPVLSTCLAANLEIKDETMHAGNWWSYCGLNDNNRPWLGREKAKQLVEDCIADNNGVLDEDAVYLIAARSRWKYDWLEKKGLYDKKGKKLKKWSKDGLIKAVSYIPYNKDMKVVCFKIGHSFHMVMNRPESLYGRIFKERLQYEKTKNAAGDYADQAKQILESKHFDKKTIAYSYYSKGQLPPAHIVRRAERYATKLFISHAFEAAYWDKFGKKCPEPYIIGFDEGGHNDYIGPEVPYDFEG